MSIAIAPIDLSRKFGIELEFGSTNIDRYILSDRLKSISKKEIYSTNWAPTDKDNEYWHLKTDSSANPESHIRRDVGYELASYVGSSLDHLLDIASVADFLKSYGCKPNRNCGFHIHLDVSDLSNTDVAKVAAWWIRVEPWMYRAVPLHRATTIHCKPLRAFYKTQCKEAPTPGLFWKAIEPRSLSHHDNPCRRLSINLVNCVEHSRNRARTIELRLPEGTLRGSDVISWVILYSSFVNTVVKFPYPTKLNSFRNIEPTLACFGMSNNNILCNELLVTKLFFLRRICMYSKFRNKKIGYIQALEEFNETHKVLKSRNKT